MDSLYNSKTYLILLDSFWIADYPGDRHVLFRRTKNEIEYGNGGSINMDNQRADAQFLVDADEIHMMEPIRPTCSKEDQLYRYQRIGEKYGRRIPIPIPVNSATPKNW
jgi:hypothetical protein